MSGTAENQRLAERAALMTRAHKREVDKAALRASWEKQAAGLGFDARALAAEAIAREAGRDAARDSGRENAPARDVDPASANAVGSPASIPENRPARGGNRQRRSRAAEAAEWAVAHLAEREAVFSRADLLAAALAWQPGAVSVEAAEEGVGRSRRSRDGSIAAPALHARRRHDHRQGP